MTRAKAAAVLAVLLLAVAGAQPGNLVINKTQGSAPLRVPPGPDGSGLCAEFCLPLVERCVQGRCVPADATSAPAPAPAPAELQVPVLG